MEETLRSQGQSGLTKHLDKHKAVANIHDHSNLVRTLGMGEVDVVMNGVHFKTRHNDYTLNQMGDSDRHFIDAKSWDEMHAKAALLSASGRKLTLENLATVPTSIRGFADDDKTEPLVANWEYRILCQPVTDVPLSMLKPVESLDEQVGAVTPPRSKAEGVRRTRSTRFELALEDGQKRAEDYGLLDKLMEQIPGKDNGPANLSDDAFGEVARHYNDKDAGEGADVQPLNVGYYSRWMTIDKQDAMGEKTVRRGYGDKAMFAARTTNPKVAPVRVHSEGDDGVVREFTQRWTYALPLELVWLTPLHSWNPHGIAYHGSHKGGTHQQVVATKATHDGAINGTHSKLYYRTPSELFADSRGPSGGDGDPADTTRRDP